MKALADWELELLIKKVYDLITKATIELGHRTDGKSMAVLAKSFAADLQRENHFRRLYLIDVELAFRNGVRLDTGQQFINIPTFFKWIRAQKILIDNDTHKVEVLKEPKANAPLYRPRIKLTNKLLK
jgi:hypothetical protein|tara:strand:+ start:8946 stop:9326 length:381 start_codon:yes stop_codon:yes gene_type:complete